jgi:four helix bundle protein
MALESYRKLEVWQKAIELVIAIYRATKELPDEEKYGLTSQVRRAAVSIPANMAEGYGRKHLAEYLHHLSMARGSLLETETLLTIAVKLEFMDRTQALGVWKLAQEVGKMLRKLILSLERKLNG